MGSTVVGNASGGFLGWCKKAWAAIKIPTAVVVLLLLALAMYLFNNPVLTWSAAIVAAVLGILKEVLASVGTAAEADAQNRHDEVHALTTATDLEKQAVDDDLRAKTALKRRYDVRSSTCGMFAVIFGVPAAASVVNSQYPFPF